MKSFPRSSNIFQLLPCSKTWLQSQICFYQGTKTPRSHLHILMTIRKNLKQAKVFLERATLIESLFIKIETKKLSFEWRENKEWETNKTPIGSSFARVLRLLVLDYPQIKIVPLCVHPNQTCIPFVYHQIKNSTQISFI